MSFQFVDWNVQRFIGGQWVPVECHTSTGVLRTLDPGETMTWGWIVKNGDHEGIRGELALVQEGLYRGVVWLTPYFIEPTDGDLAFIKRQLFAEFTVA